MFWAKAEFNSDWVNNLRGDAMIDAMDTRVNGVIGKTKGLLVNIITSLLFYHRIVALFFYASCYSIYE